MNEEKYMHICKEYHHFKGDYLNRVERIERFVVKEILNSPIKDDERESSCVWELLHSSSCKSIIHILAEKNAFPSDIARIAGALHDYYVIKTGTYRDHARLAVPLVIDILNKDGSFSEKEISLISEMVSNHSDKHIYTDNFHIEAMKDADVFDCCMYKGTEEFYLTKKSLPVCREYFQRFLRISKNFGIPLPNAYNSLEKELNSKLISINKTIGIEETNFGPTIILLLLWSMSSTVVGRKIPIILVYCDGNILSWKAPKQYFCNNEKYCTLTWKEISMSFVQAKQLSDELVKSIDSENIKLTIELSLKLLKVCNIDLLIANKIYEESAIVLQEIDCNPQADKILSSSINNIIQSSETLMSSLNHIASHHKKIIEDRFGGFNQRPNNHDTIPQKWNLSLAQEESINNISKLESLKILKKEICILIYALLNNLGKKINRDVLNSFPSYAFNNEQSQLISNEDTNWLAVAWPRFDKYEFIVGEEANSRYNTLYSYYNE